MAEPNRRTLLAGVAAVSMPVAATTVIAELAPLVRPASTPSLNLDESLLSIEPLYVAAQRQLQAADRHLDEVSERYDALPSVAAPDALLWRHDDDHIFGDFEVDEEWSGGSRSGRRGFFSPRTFDVLRLAQEQVIARLAQTFAACDSTERKLARFNEVLVAGETWMREIREQWITSGMDAAERVSDESAKQLADVVQKIFARPASTSAGLALKLRVAADQMREGNARAENVLLERIQNGDGSDETLAFSIVLDLLRQRQASDLKQITGGSA